MTDLGPERGFSPSDVRRANDFLEDFEPTLDVVDAGAPEVPMDQVDIIAEAEAREAAQASLRPGPGATPIDTTRYAAALSHEVVRRDPSESLDYDQRASGADILAGSEFAPPTREVLSDIDYQRFVQQNRRKVTMNIDFLVNSGKNMSEKDRAKQIAELVDELPDTLRDSRFEPPVRRDDQESEFAQIVQELDTHLKEPEFDQVIDGYFQEIATLINSQRLPDIMFGGRVTYSPSDLEFLTKWREFFKTYPATDIQVEGTNEDWQKWVEEVKAQAAVDQSTTSSQVTEKLPTTDKDTLKVPEARSHLEDQLESLQTLEKSLHGEDTRPLSKPEIQQGLKKQKNGQYEILSQEPGFNEQDWLDREYQRFIDSSLVKWINQGRYPTEELRTRLDQLLELSVRMDLTERVYKSFLAEVGAAAGVPSPALTKVRELTGDWSRYNSDLVSAMRSVRFGQATSEAAVPPVAAAAALPVGEILDVGEGAAVEPAPQAAEVDPEIKKKIAEETLLENGRLLNAFLNDFKDFKDRDPRANLTKFEEDQRAKGDERTWDEYSIATIMLDARVSALDLDHSIKDALTEEVYRMVIDHLKIELKAYRKADKVPRLLPSWEILSKYVIDNSAAYYDVSDRQQDEPYMDDLLAAIDRIEARDKIDDNIEALEDFLQTHPQEAERFSNEDESYFKKQIEEVRVAPYDRRDVSDPIQAEARQREVDSLYEERLGLRAEDIYKSELPFADQNVQRLLGLFAKEERVMIIRRVQELMQRKEQENGS
jgi:hypothetical protein